VGSGCQALDGPVRPRIDQRLGKRIASDGQKMALTLRTAVERRGHHLVEAAEGRQLRHFGSAALTLLLQRSNKGEVLS
jgi:hypothetical protein